MIAKTFIATDSCNNCGLCVKNCPLNAISIINDRPYWSFNCESCMRCMNNCPQRAIETAHSYVVLLWWIAFSLIPVQNSVSVTKKVSNNLTSLKTTKH